MKEENWVDLNQNHVLVSTADSKFIVKMVNKSKD